ncbi:MAG: BatA domain-containing protein [Gemmatimonadota bacterium]
MSLLHAWALGLALLAAVPVLLHRRKRERSRRVPFPALRYLRRARQAHARAIRAGDLLLLMTRAGLILLLSLIAAGLLLGHGSPVDHWPTDIAIVVDNSASTSRLVGDRPLLDLLVERARTTLAAARPADRFWILATVGPPLAVGETSGPAAAALARVRQTDGRGNLLAAWARARGALPATAGRRREIHVLSDLQRSGLAPAVDAVGGRDSAARAKGGGEDVPLIVFRPPPLSESNGFIRSVELPEGRSAPRGTPLGVLIAPERTVRGRFPDGSSRRSPPLSAASGPSTPPHVRLEIDGDLVGAARVSWGTTAALRLPALGPGPHRGRAAIERDGLRADDARQFSFRVVPPPSVRHLGPPDSFVGLALGTLRDAGRIAKDAPDVLLVEGAPETWPGANDASSESVLIVVPPAAPAELPRLNQLLRRANIAWRLQADTSRGGLRLRTPVDSAAGLADARIARRYLLRASGAQAGGDTAVWKTADGEPWLIVGKRDGRTYVLLGSPLDADATSIPASPAMIPFLETLLLRWSGSADWPNADFEAGQPFRLPDWADSVARPDGASQAVEGGAPFTAFRSGLYRVSGRRVRFGGGSDLSESPAAAFVAVNTPLAESDLTPASFDSLPELFPGQTVLIADPDEQAWRRAIYRGRRGREAAPWLVLLAAALAVLEIVLATPGRRSAPDGPSPLRAGEGDSSRTSWSIAQS